MIPDDPARIARRQEWDRLLAERRHARAQLVRSVTTISHKAKDPFGLKEQVRRHPIAAAGIAAGAGALLGSLVLSRIGRRPDDDGDSREHSNGNGNGHARPRRESDIGSALMDAAIKAAIPRLVAFVADRMTQPRADDGDVGA